MTGSLNIEVYSTLIDRVLKPRKVLSVPGNLLEIGCMQGGGTELLGRYAAGVDEARRVWAVDAFDFGLDPTVNSRGQSMETIYRWCSESEESSYKRFLERTRDLGNVELFIGDSRVITLPEEPLCFAFVDGGHTPECVFNDFELVWRRLSPGGVIAFHDFGGDLPEVTDAICRVAEAHADEIGTVETIPELWVVWIEKRAPGTPARPDLVREMLNDARNRYRLVVASYHEDLAWTGRVTGPVCIYDASGERKGPGVVPVPNRAREAGQYLTHIVENYPRFHEWEVFVQGNPFEHTDDPLLRGGAFDGSWAPFQPLGRVACFNPQHSEHDRWAATFAREWLGGIPVGLHWVVGAQFGVHRKLLLNRSLDYWVALRRKALEEENTSPWALERLWAAVI